MMVSFALIQRSKALLTNDEERGTISRHTHRGFTIQSLLEILQRVQDAGYGRPHPKREIGPRPLRRLGPLARRIVALHPRAPPSFGVNGPIRRPLIRHTTIPRELAPELRLPRDHWHKPRQRRSHHRKLQPRRTPNLPPLRPRLLRIPSLRPSSEHHSPDVPSLARTPPLANLPQLHRGDDNPSQTSHALQTPRRSLHVPVHAHDLGRRRSRHANGIDLNPAPPPNRLRRQECEIPIGKDEHSVPEHASSNTCTIIVAQYRRFRNSYLDDRISPRFRGVHPTHVVDELPFCRRSA